MSGTQAAFDEILSLDLSSCRIQFCLASIQSELVPSIQRVQVTDAVVEEFREVIAGELSQRRSEAKKGDLILKGYDPQTKPDRHELECLSLEEHPGIRTQLAGLSDLASLDVFQEDQEFISQLRFYILVVETGGKPVYFFRTYTPKKELARSTLFAIAMRAGAYDRVDETMFLLDQHLDCVIRGEDLFIFNKSNFQRIFQFYKMLLASAKQTLRTIRERIPIDNFAAFEAACEGHLQKLSKLKNIASKPYLEQITIGDLKKVIERYGLPIETVGTGTDEKIKFDQSDKWAILRLLDDDYLESVMTNRHYEVSSKRAI